MNKLSFRGKYGKWSEEDMERAFYKSVMRNYNKECDHWMRTEKTTVTTASVCHIFGQAYVRSVSMAIAISGFKSTGIWPCDRNIWHDADFAAAGRFEWADSILRPR
jgi:hypothetical protein